MKKLSLLVLLFVPMLASAEDMPLRKPGLWEIRTAGPATVAGNNIRQCIDEKTDKEMLSSVGGVAGKMGGKCAQATIRKEGADYVHQADCQFPNHHIVTKTIFSGDFSSNYTSTNITHFDPPMMGHSDEKRVSNAKWIGPCEAGQQPGDMIFGNGMKMNMFALKKTFGGQK